ncbi:predicted protein [Histoplasma mississippiense (nom. inval.)]|uniref:predicted protein n=1 Tax=Ajellomyces capsulatus (strain NAm1 / WU24) TaxID=2059318 RepID=UPI000157B463|nr:predicted protein [Histoplasma mississippiense (nom. inval.)]EDN03011.1 predicted protein [Histoplasma mississippiense (nom. inval.)]
MTRQMSLGGGPHDARLRNWCNASAKPKRASTPLGHSRFSPLFVLSPIECGFLLEQTFNLPYDPIQTACRGKSSEH